MRLAVVVVACVVMVGCVSSDPTEFRGFRACLVDKGGRFVAGTVIGRQPTGELRFWSDENRREDASDAEKRTDGHDVVPKRIHVLVSCGVSTARPCVQRSCRVAQGVDVSSASDFGPRDNEARP